MAEISRRRSATVNVGGIKVGGTNPIVVQSMTNTDTADVQSTVNQAMALARAGSELVRVTVNTEAAAAAVPKIVFRTMIRPSAKIDKGRILPLRVRPVDR